MRITAIRATPVSVPFTEAETWAFGRVRGISNLILEMETDEGVTGIGEAVGFPSSAVVKAILDGLATSLEGEDPTNIESIVRKVLRQRGWHHYKHVGNGALGGIEMACWDILGKTTNQPVHRLLGGALRDKIPYYRYIPAKDLDAMAKDARAAVKAGFETLYLKVGLDEERDIEMVRTVRDAAGPKPRLRVDANEAWAPPDAIRIIRRMAEYELEFVEQPNSCYDLDTLAYIRAHVPVPIGANQAAWTEYDALEIVKRQAADFVLTDQHQLGGMLMFKKVAALLEMAQVPVIKHSFGDLGISTRAGMHVLATCANATRANQTHFQVLQDDVVEGGLLEFEHGALKVPDAPGLGATLDPERLGRAAERYRSQGEFSAFGG
jgi:L-alanine-DL-glutamate epimerase-like enolase superfamily enzyme